MMTIKQYAEHKGITYEAVRKQIERYSAELSCHVVISGRRKILDDFAVEFLDSKRKDNPVIMANEEKVADVEKLKQDNAELTNQIILLQQQVTIAQQQVIEAQQKQIEAAEISAKYSVLLETSSQTVAQLAEAHDQIAQLHAEASSYRRSWFGFYRKSKK